MNTSQLSNPLKGLYNSLSDRGLKTTEDIAKEVGLANSTLLLLYSFCATFCTSFAPHLNHLQPPFILRPKNVNYEHFVPKEPCIYQAMFCCKWHFGAFHDELLTILCRALFCLAMSHNTNLGGSIFCECWRHDVANIVP